MKPIIKCSLILVLSLIVAPVYADDLQDGMDAYERKDYMTAFEKLKPLADQGNAKAQGRLGWMYEKGQGVPKDNLIAAEWYRTAAEQGNASALRKLKTLEGKERRTKNLIPISSGFLWVITLLVALVFFINAKKISCLNCNNPFRWKIGLKKYGSIITCKNCMKKFTIIVGNKKLRIVSNIVHLGSALIMSADIVVGDFISKFLEIDDLNILAALLTIWLYVYLGGLVLRKFYDQLEKVNV